MCPRTRNRPSDGWFVGKTEGVLNFRMARDPPTIRRHVPLELSISTTRHHQLINRLRAEGRHDQSPTYRCPCRKRVRMRGVSILIVNPSLGNDLDRTYSRVVAGRHEF